jgi:hypothetical protein
MSTTPQDRKPKGGGHQFTVKGKTYTLPPIGEDAASAIPGEITYDAVMQPGNDFVQMRLALATLEAVVGADSKALAALKTLPTKDMLEVVGAWMGESSGSSD